MYFSFIETTGCYPIKYSILNCVNEFANKPHTMVDYDNIIEDLSRARDNHLLSSREYYDCIRRVNNVKLHVK